MRFFSSLHSVLEIARDLDPRSRTRCPYYVFSSPQVRSIVTNVRDEFANRIDSRFLSGVGRRSRDNVTQPRKFTEFAGESCFTPNYRLPAMSFIEFNAFFIHISSCRNPSTTYSIIYQHNTYYTDLATLRVQTFYNTTTEI